MNYLLDTHTLMWRYRDPFDRVIVSQALTDNMTIVTKDKTIVKYKVKTVW